MQYTQLHSWLFALACVLCTLPLWVGHYPPMADIPQHAAQIAAIKGLLQGDWPFAELFELRWFTPYWLGYGLVLALSFAIGVLPSLKLVLALSMAALPWSAVRFCRKAGVDARLTWLLLLMPFGFAYYWGFLSFMVAMPLGFLFLSSALDLREKTDGRIWLKMALWVHALFFAHLLIAAFCCIVAGLMLVSPWQGIRSWLRRVSPLFAVLPVALLWLATTLTDSAQANEPVQWGLRLAMRLQYFLPRMIGSPDVPVVSLLGLLILALPFLAGSRFATSPGRWLPFAFYIVFELFFPVSIMGNSFTASRFGVFGVPLYLLCFVPVHSSVANTQPRHPNRLVGPLAAAIAILMLGWHTLRASIIDIQSKGYSEVVARADPGKRMLSLIFQHGSMASSAPVFMHFPAWYQAEHNGLTEPSFARAYAIPLQFRDRAGSAIEQGFGWRPDIFDWEWHHGERYDYFLTRSGADPGAWLIGKSGCRLRLVSRSGQWRLYEQTPKAYDCEPMQPAVAPN